MLVIKAQQGASRPVAAPALQAATTQPLFRSVIDPSGRDTCDLGYVLPRSLSRASFRVRHTSGQPLRLKHALSECTCVTVESYPNSVSPGQDGEVVVLFAAPEQTLMYRKSIILIPEGGGQPLVRYLTARVGIPLAVEPDEIDAGQIASGRPATKTVHVVNDSDAAVGLISVASEDAACVLELSQKPVDAHARQPLSLTIDSAGKAVGRYSTDLSIKTSSAAVPTLSLAVTYEVVAGHE